MFTGLVFSGAILREKKQLYSFKARLLDDAQKNKTEGKLTELFYHA